LLSIILGDADRLEALRVLVTAKPCGKSWKTVAAVNTLCLGYLALSAPGIDYGPCIASFIDSLAQVFWRRPMIGLSRVTPFFRIKFDDGQVDIILAFFRHQHLT
jgi:hypothetical protein